MEIVYTDTLKNDKLISKNIVGFYGDILDLLDMGEDIKGITYNPRFKVSHFLSLFKHGKNRLIGILKYLELNENILKKKISDLSLFEFKLILLAYLLINNKKVLIFDHFEVGLNYKERKQFVSILRKLKTDGKNIILVSKDLVFMNDLVNKVIVYDKKIVFEGNMEELIKKHIVSDPNIITFIKLSNEKGANLSYTLNELELLKDIYRSVM